MSELDDIVQALTKQFGQGSTFRMSQMPETGVAGWTSTGSAAIDEVIGREGIPDARVTTILGKPSTGKTTLVTHMIVECQKRGGFPFYWPTEFSYDPDRAKQIGVDPERLVIGYPGYVEQAFEMLGAIASQSSGEHPIHVFWDTFSATPTRAEVYGTGQAGDRREKAGEFNPEVSTGGTALGEHARLASIGMRKYQGIMEKKNVTLVVVLQSKQKIGVMFGSQVTYLAERVWHFYSNVQLECTHVGKIKSGDEDIGIRMQVYCRKNKVAPPFKKCEVECLFESGIDDAAGLLEKAITMGLVRVTGKGRFAYTASDSSVVKFTRAGRKGWNWKELLRQVPQLREIITAAGGQDE